MKKFKPVLWSVAAISLALVIVFTFVLYRVNEGKPVPALKSFPKNSLLRTHIERNELSSMLGDMRITSNHLKLDSFPVTKNNKVYNVHFTLDKDLQEKIESVYEKHSPVFAAFVAMDPVTGKILAMTDYNTLNKEGNLALKATYPAASVFKVVTSTAALDDGKINRNSMFPVNGSYGTLYKRNLRDTINRWTRYISIEEAFAKSVNTVFAKIAMHRVGPSTLQRYANNFGFNQHLDFDMPIDMGSAAIPTNDEFGLAESGSGYTRRQTLNPLQGAMMAAAVINEGKMPAPYLVDHVTNSQGVKIYEAEEKTISHPMDKETAKSLAMIMEHTITKGTARKEYRDYNHNPTLSKLFIGGKTGSLSGDSPAGRYDWFVGFAQSSTNPKRKIVFASMVVNRQYWKIRAAQVAREAILEYFNKTRVQDL